MSAETTLIDGDEYVKAAQTEEIPKGRGIAINVDGIEIAVFNADGEFYAISNRCSHQHASMCKAGEEKINADHTWTKTRGGTQRRRMYSNLSLAPLEVRPRDGKERTIRTDDSHVRRRC